MNQDIIDILHAVKNQELSVEEALLKIRQKPFADIGYAKVDLHRNTRQGAAEVIFGAGKTPEQICGIIATMFEHGQDSILITRLKPEFAEIIGEKYNLEYFSEAKLGYVGEPGKSADKSSGIGNIVVATGGTSDIPIAEEAALTAEFYGNNVIRLYDVGVAGLHRLLSHLDEIMSAGVIIAVAGMEGALASVIGGLVDCPVIAVPTSVGYGASFSGLTALLSMLNSCSSGVSVVNIDNGFGAGYLANMINHMGR
ncbi:MAG TPA: nickel pincer cofactor biosynthesis protein LarB [Clostridiaceae bacterium]|nr:nickel pincer cofactor biosynthesis protein LarB [Clostridiaceae bacterium]